MCLQSPPTEVRRYPDELRATRRLVLQFDSCADQLQLVFRHVPASLQVAPENLAQYTNFRSTHMGLRPASTNIECGPNLEPAPNLQSQTSFPKKLVSEFGQQSRH